MNVSVWADSHIGRVRKDQEDAFLVDLPLLALADGMGGEARGKETAQLITQTLAQQRPRTIEALGQALGAADREAFDRWERQCGSTVDAVLLGETVQGLHAGDSRVYWAKKVGRGALARRAVLQMTRDHSSGPYLSNFVGRGRAVLDPITVNWAVGDFILLCSDGLTNELKDHEIGDVLWSRTRNPARALVRHVVQKTPARDNVTVVVARRLT